MSSWHNRQRRRASRKRLSATRKYVFSDGTVIYDDRDAVMRKVRECNWDISYRVERLDWRAA